jgi:hypothetical protein
MSQASPLGDFINIRIIWLVNRHMRGHWGLKVHLEGRNCDGSRTLQGPMCAPPSASSALITREPTDEIYKCIHGK